jgi:hypothetical protein
MTFFIYKVSSEVMAKFHQNPDLCRNGESAQKFLIHRTGRVPATVTRKSLTIWSHIIDHRKAERVTYQNGIRDFWSFGQSETQKWSSSQPLFCPERNSAVTLVLKIPKLLNR